MYADNLILIADCASNLQKQLYRVGEQANEDDVVYNAKNR